jgi:hypothetical protein
MKNHWIAQLQSTMSHGQQSHKQYFSHMCVGSVWY